MNEYDILDLRPISNFKTKTFSGYNKLHVKKELLTNLILQDIESSCFWSVELICSFLFNDLWDIIFLFIVKNVRIANPEISIYVLLQYNTFKSIYSNDEQFTIRNNQKIRKLFAQIIVVCCKTKQSPAFELIKIDKNTQPIFKINDTSFSDIIIKNNDPEILIKPINELIFYLQNKDFKMSCFWITWIIENDNKLICSKRNYSFIHDTDAIWIIWDVIFLWQTEKYESKIIQFLFQIFQINYKHSSSKKHIYLFYYITEILCLNQKINIEHNIIKIKDKIQIVEEHINDFYKDIKSNENNKEMSYLFYSLQQSSSSP
uniref:Uncharacterized protein n=1 Tax=viral metagenome TaxID=1070528 RepID=A0A6C0H5G7_9ZZZZ